MVRRIVRMEILQFVAFVLVPRCAALLAGGGPKMQSIKRNIVARSLLFVWFFVVLIAVGTSQSSAKCAFADEHFKRDATVSIAPGPSTAGPGWKEGETFTAKVVCFNGDMPCHKRYGCFKTALRLSDGFIRYGGQPKKKRLLGRFGYIDPYGIHWDVPANIETDGATIPSALQPIVGSSWDKDYLRAAVVHDFYIRKTTADPKRVHEMFLNALLADGVRPYWATMMYRAVRRFGPTWKTRDLAENERIRLANAAQQAKFDREFHQRYQQCLLSRKERLRAAPGQRGFKCALRDDDELVFSLSEILLDDVLPSIDRDMKAGKCVLGPDGIWDCPTIDRRERYNRR